MMRRRIARGGKMIPSSSSSSSFVALALALLVVLSAISAPSAEAQQVQQNAQQRQQPHWPQAPTNPPFQQKQAEEAEERRAEAERVAAKEAATIAEADARDARDDPAEVEQQQQRQQQQSGSAAQGQNQNQNQQPPPPKQPPEVLNAQELREQHAQRQAGAAATAQRREEMERRRAEMNRQQHERQAERERARAEAEQRRAERQAEAEAEAEMHRRRQQQQQPKEEEATEGQKAGLPEELVERQKLNRQQAQQQQAQQQQGSNAGTSASANSANAKAHTKVQPNNTPGKATKKKVVGTIELRAGNFDSSMRDGSAWLIEFYAPWCGHCKRFAATYEKVAETLHAQSHADVMKDPNARTVKVAKVDGSADRALASRFNIRGYPTFFLVDGWNVYEFEGDRTLEDLVDFATEDYVDYEPIPFVNSPFGPMGQLRALFIWAGTAAASSFEWMVNERGFSEVVAAMIMMGAAIVVGLFLIIFIGLMSVAKPKMD